MNIQLFLAHADDQQPIADDGIPIEATFDAPAPELPVPVATRFMSLAGAPDSLPEQQWALVAPKGEIGDRLLELVAPLKRRREEEQGREAIVYRVDPGMDSLAAANWIQRDYRDAVGRIGPAHSGQTLTSIANTWRNSHAQGLRRRPLTSGSSNSSPKSGNCTGFGAVFSCGGTYGLADAPHPRPLSA